MKKIVCISFLLAFALACKKYPEGPAFSLKSRKERVSNYWKPAYYSVNGTDNTAQVDTMNVRYLFKKTGYYFETMDHPGMTMTSEGTWSFKGRDEYIEVLRPNSDTLLYEILKLKEKELWLKRSIFGIVYELHLVPAE